MTTELGCVLGIPLCAAIVLALVGHGRAAGTINAVFSLLTLIAAAFLTRRIINDGAMWAYDMQFYVDALNVFLIACGLSPSGLRRSGARKSSKSSWPDWPWNWRPGAVQPCALSMLRQAAHWRRHAICCGNWAHWMRSMRSPRMAALC